MDSENKNIAEFDYDYKKIVPPRLHRFYEIIGKEKYEEVLEVYGGNPLYLNQKESYERELRNWNIYKDYKNGMEYFDLTSKYKLSVTTIRNITAQCQKKRKTEIMKKNDYWVKNNSEK